MYEMYPTLQDYFGALSQIMPLSCFCTISHMFTNNALPFYVIQEPKQSCSTLNMMYLSLDIYKKYLHIKKI